MEPILSDNGYDLFVIEYNENTETIFDFSVYEITAWNENNKPLSAEPYIHGQIKWDGCSHIYFGVKGDDGETPGSGYIHICGKKHWKLHCELMMAVYELAAKKIVNYNSDVAEH